MQACDHAYAPNTQARARAHTQTHARTHTRTQVTHAGTRPGPAARPAEDLLPPQRRTLRTHRPTTRTGALQFANAPGYHATCSARPGTAERAPGSWSPAPAAGCAWLPRPGDARCGAGTRARAARRQTRRTCGRRASGTTCSGSAVEGARCGVGPAGLRTPEPLWVPPQRFCSARHTHTARVRGTTAQAHSPTAVVCAVCSLCPPPLPPPPLLCVPSRAEDAQDAARRRCQRRRVRLRLHLLLLLCTVGAAAADAP